MRILADTCVWSAFLRPAPTHPAACGSRSPLTAVHDTRTEVRLSCCTVRPVGVPGPEGTLIRYPLTQRALADGLGVVERSVRRALGEWKKEGLLTTKKGWFVITDFAKLDALSGDLRFSINYRPEVDLKRMAERDLGE